MPDSKQFYAFKLFSTYSEKELSVYYQINPQTFQEVRVKDGKKYAGVEFYEKDADTGLVDHRNSGRLQELMDNGWFIYETAAKAAAFLTGEDEVPVYVPTNEELGK